MTETVKTIDVKTVFRFFIIFIKTYFLTFLFFEHFLFSGGRNFNSTKSAKLLYKTILSDEFNLAYRGNPLIKSHISQTLSIVMHTIRH